MTAQNRELLAQSSRRALDLFRRRISVGPVAIPQIQESVLAQLEWLTEFAEGRNEERARLSSLIFGHYVAREELDPQDHELNDALTKAFFAANQYSRGLKVDPSTIAEMPPNNSLERTREG